MQEFYHKMEVGGLAELTQQDFVAAVVGHRSEEHTSELQSHSFISYAVFCLKKKKYILAILLFVKH